MMLRRSSSTVATRETATSVNIPGIASTVRTINESGPSEVPEKTGVTTTTDRLVAGRHGEPVATGKRDRVCVRRQFHRRPR